MSYKIVYFDNSPITQLGFKTLFIQSSFIDIEILEEKFYSAKNQELIDNSVFIFNVESISEKFLAEFTNNIDSVFANKKVVLIIKEITKFKLETLIKKGVLGFIHLNSGRKEIEACLKSINKDCLFVCPKIKNLNFQNTSNSYPNINITSSEILVIKLILEGKTTSEIAHILYKSKRTIEAHRSNIASKFDLKGQGVLTRFLIKNKDTIADLLSSQNTI